MSNKLTRKQLIDLVRRPEEFKRILTKLLEEDRVQAELFLRYYFVNEPPLPDAPVGWQQRAAQLAAKNPLVREAVRRLSASLTFDSWAAVPGGIRDTAVMNERRLRFEVNGLVIDIRAERTDSGWDFVAGVIQGSVDESEIAFAVGSKTIHPGETGFLQWSSKRLPRNMTVRIDDVEIELPQLTWK